MVSAYIITACPGISLDSKTVLSSGFHGIRIRETSFIIQWVMIYLMDSITQNNWSQIKVKHYPVNEC